LRAEQQRGNFMDRRTAIRHIASSPLLASGLLASRRVLGQQSTPGPFRLATFAADITPPIGSPLCGGWIKPVQSIEDPLQALGIVLLGGEKPIVLCALDWVETNNSAYEAWRVALAAAAGTDPNHVAVQCVHPHDSPWANLDAHELARQADASLHLMHPEAFQLAVTNTAQALRQSLAQARPVTHLGTGQARVQEVASARRVLGPEGTVVHSRTSTCFDAEARALPEGTIDPFLKTLSFWNEAQPVAALHYYATHPMSRYGQGQVSSDFCGLARDRRREEQSDVFQVYFTGCAGDVTAGKYNDGSEGMREVLTDRIHAAMVSAWEATLREPLTAPRWSVEPVSFQPRPEPMFAPESLRATLADGNAAPAARLKAAIILSWLNRIDQPIDISCLRIGKTSVLHLPGEPFIHYQLLAQRQQPDGFVCVAGYGDGGTGYLPRQVSFDEGGYEPTMCFVARDSETLLTTAIERLLAST
jgi:hypothetical protein